MSLLLMLTPTDLSLQSPLRTYLINQPITTKNPLQMKSNLPYQLLPDDKLIIGNPLNSPQCRNAIINKQNIDIIDLLITHLPIIYNIKSNNPLIKHMIQFLTNRTIPQIWGREQLNALTHNVEWWSGASAHVSYDPFWYLNRIIDPTNDFQTKQLEFQHNKISHANNDKIKERNPWYYEIMHSDDIQTNENFTLDQRIVVDYNLRKLIRVDEYKNEFTQHMNMPQVAYYHIPKCGSSSMRWMLYKIGGTRISWKQSWFEGYPKPTILHRNIQCGFTFVRHPIHRFISAYYTLNHMLIFDTIHSSKSDREKNNTLYLINKSLKHWNIIDECYYNYSCLYRINVFVKQLVNDSWQWMNGYHNVLSTRVMEHIGSIVGNFMGNYDGWNIHYIGKLEYFEKHWMKLSREIKECSVGYLDRYWNGSDVKKRFSNGFPGEDSRLAMQSMRSGLKHDKTEKTMHRTKGMGQKGRYTLNRPLVDAYYAFALNRELYDTVVNYYYQDFVCFGYDMRYESFMKYILEKDPSFDRSKFPENIVF